MRNFSRNTKGAVTVFVTLLLVPAILVTGTGVDLARVYAARATTHDANQLAANSILTTYDALLQDLYGLYAVVDKDDNLSTMVDVYVRASLFGEEVTDAQLSEFRLFGGQESVSSSVSSSAPLSNVEILRRQIEEYSKWRVPVAIVSDILERLDKDEEFKKLAANTEAAQKKIAVDEQLEVVLEKFKAVKEKADEIVKEYNWDEYAGIKSINEVVEQIRKQLGDMYRLREAYEAEPNDSKIDIYMEQYQAISDNIKACAEGGWVGTGWVAAHIDDNGNDVAGEWSNPKYKNMGSGYKEIIDFEVDKLKAYEAELDTLVSLCREADSAKDELQTRINALEGKLNDGTCNSELVTNMSTELDEYRELLNYNFAQLGQTMKTEGVRYINNVVAPLKQITGYGRTDGTNSIILSFADLKNAISLPGFQIDLNINTTLYSGVTDRLTRIANSAVDVYTAHQRLPSFRSLSDTHEACYKLLENLDSIGVTDEPRSQDEEGEKSKVTDIFKTVKTLWAGLTDYDGSPGANSYSKPAGYSGAFTTQGQGMELDFGLTDFSFGDDNEAGTIKSTLNTLTGLVSGKIGVTDMIGNVLNNATNRVLLVGYATNMFSNQTTNLQLDDDGNVKELLSLTGQPIDAEHNYFYTSEWEYLFNGSLKTSDNLAKVTVTLLAIRFLANYASSYIITSVNAEIRSYEAAVSAIPFAGAALRFLVRPLVVLVESALDVSWLRGGEEVLLIKTTADDWTFSISGSVASTLKGIAENMTESNSDGLKLYYTDYLMVFLLASEPDAIAARTGDLIALNITTQKNSAVQNAKGDDRATAIASVTLYDLSKAYTTFAVSTTTEVRFMFLSMPLAQSGLNGIVPSTTFPVVATDYRGY